VAFKWSLQFFKNNFGNATNGVIDYYGSYTTDETTFPDPYLLDITIITPEEFKGQVLKAIYRIGEFRHLFYASNSLNEPRPEKFSEAIFYIIMDKA